MKTSREKIQQAADRLFEAYRANTPCEPVRELLEAQDIDAAYEVQSLNHARRRSAGEKIVGCKIGLTSKTVQQQLGIAESDTGLLFAGDVFREDQDIPMEELIQPKVEGEIALVLERDLKQERPTVADVISATAYCLPAIEIVDSRIKNWDIKIVDTIADNASSRFIVIGGKPVSIKDIDFELCGMRMQKNGETVSVGIGSASLGNPLNAAAWLAGKRVSFGMPLEAGSVILTGALGPMAKVIMGDRIEVRIAGMGSVQARFI